MSLDMKMLAEMLAKNPELLKEMEKLAGVGKPATPVKRTVPPQPSFLLRNETRCTFCNTTSRIVQLFNWNPDTVSHRLAKTMLVVPTDNQLEVKHQKFTVSSCVCCRVHLQQYPVDMLIDLILGKIPRLPKLSDIRDEAQLTLQFEEPIELIVEKLNSKFREEKEDE